MEADELVTIGHFARLSGLSVHTLRHYDDVGLLHPAEVDPATGYRRYRRDQTGQARLIKALRWIDLPIEQVGLVLGDPGGEAALDVLRRHRHRLRLARNQIDDQLADVDRFLQERLTMTAPSPTGVRPVQLKIAVDDLDTAIAFYHEAFGFGYEVTRRTQDAEFSGFVFGRHDQPDTFFLLHLLCPDDFDNRGPCTFGLLCDDLDAVHARAVAAGATEVGGPHDAEGMPRCSVVKDPSGNFIWLYQG